MSEHMDGDRESVRRARASESSRPVGADASPRMGDRPEERRPLTPGPGTAPTGVPSATGPGEEPGALPPESEPGKAAAWAIIGALILLIGLVTLPFFAFSIVVAIPTALALLAIAAVFLAAWRKGRCPGAS